MAPGSFTYHNFVFKKRNATLYSDSFLQLCFITRLSRLTFLCQWAGTLSSPLHVSKGGAEDRACVSGSWKHLCMLTARAHAKPGSRCPRTRRSSCAVEIQPFAEVTLTLGQGQWPAARPAQGTRRQQLVFRKGPGRTQEGWEGGRPKITVNT